MLLRFSFLIAWCGPLIFTSCQTSPVAGGGAYHVTAYKPHDPSKVVVKVSLSKQNIYVMEGDRCLMAVACSVGIPSKPTPRGHFTIYRKEEDKRSGSYGFRVQGDRVVPAEAGSNVPGRYVGYPMGFWCEFAPAYGFHQGFVHPTPRTHGCIRLHGEAAPKFYALVRVGTPVAIADDATGRRFAWSEGAAGAMIRAHRDPDPHISISFSSISETEWSRFS